MNGSEKTPGRRTAEEFCRFSVRVQDHLKAARLDKEQTEVQAREVAVFLCGMALVGWEADVRQTMTKNSSATI